MSLSLAAAGAAVDAVVAAAAAEIAAAAIVPSSGPENMVVALRYVLTACMIAVAWGAVEDNVRAFRMVLAEQAPLGSKMQLP